MNLLKPANIKVVLLVQPVANHLRPYLDFMEFISITPIVIETSECNISHPQKSNATRKPTVDDTVFLSWALCILLINAPTAIAEAATITYA